MNMSRANLFLRIDDGEEGDSPPQIVGEVELMIAEKVNQRLGISSSVPVVIARQTMKVNLSASWRQLRCIEYSWRQDADKLTFIVCRAITTGTEDEIPSQRKLQAESDHRVFFF
jgi:hypothetical protein